MIQTVLESGVVTVEKELCITPIVIERDSGSMVFVGGRWGIFCRKADSLYRPFRI